MHWYWVSLTRMMLDGKKHLYLLISLFISHCGLSPHFPDSSLGKSGRGVIITIFHTQEFQTKNCKICKIRRDQPVFLLPPMLDMMVLKHLHGHLVSHPQTFWSYRKFPSTVLMTLTRTFFPSKANDFSEKLNTAFYHPHPLIFGKSCFKFVSISSSKKPKKISHDRSRFGNVNSSL